MLCLFLMLASELLLMEGFFVHEVQLCSVCGLELPPKCL